MPPALLSLPDEVLKSILTHVSLQDRLGSCCLVHTRLHTAAVAATQHVEQTFSTHSQEREQSLLSWLSLYGQHVTRLRMSCPRGETLTQLPCPNLLELCLEQGSIQLGPTPDGRPGVVEGITKLTRLDLQNTAVAGSVAESLPRLVHLGHLCIGAGFSAATLPRLSGLTYLRLYNVSLLHLRQLHALTALQELDCTGQLHVAVSPSSVSDLALPPSLTRLVLVAPSGTEQAAEMAVLPLAPTGLQALQVYLRAGRAPPEPLLPCIARLQRLTELDLFAWTSMAWPPAGPVYSALTASSSLVSLRVGASLPPGVWPFVFRAAHQLPHLTSLSLDSESDEMEPRGAFAAADLASLVSCCPGLCAIDSMWLQPGPHVSELRKLTALTALYVRCGHSPMVDSDAVVKGLAAVTQLKDLTAELGEAFAGVARLLPLTSLTALTTTYCSWWEDDLREVVHCTRAGSTPDVWLQLLERCVAADPSCQCIALCSLAQQLAEQRALTAAQQQQLSAQAQQIAGLQAQLSDQQQRNDMLQQQHAAAQQIAAKQGARFAAVEGRLQQLEAQQQVAAEQGVRFAALEGQLQLLLQR